MSSLNLIKKIEVNRWDTEKSSWPSHRNNKAKTKKQDNSNQPNKSPTISSGEWTKLTEDAKLDWD